jgi:site-specific DNA-methyltransferase (adenine-specific)
MPAYGDQGNASRYFYCAKTSKDERKFGLGGDIKANTHPTVKPVELMRYLVRLVTPKGGVVLDPFMGSGSTGMGAREEDFNFIGIEKEEEYYEIAKARIKNVKPQLKLFDL